MEGYVHIKRVPHFLKYYYDKAKLDEAAAAFKQSVSL